MLKYLSSLSNRTKAIYLIWVFINFVLLLISGNLSENYSFDSDFFPFHNGHLKFRLDDFDYSEFIIYALTPIIIYVFIKLWVGENKILFSKLKTNNPLKKEIPTDNIKSNRVDNENTHLVEESANHKSLNEGLNNVEYLSSDKALTIWFIYVLYLIIWTIFISQVSIESDFAYTLGLTALAWLPPILTGCYRYLRYKKPTKGFFAFYFIWTTIFEVFILISQIGMSKYLQNH